MKKSKKPGLPQKDKKGRQEQQTTELTAKQTIPLAVSDQYVQNMPHAVQEQSTVLSMPRAVQLQSAGLNMPLAVKKQSAGLSMPHAVLQQSAGLNMPHAVLQQSAGLNMPLAVEEQSETLQQETSVPIPPVLTPSNSPSITAKPRSRFSASDLQLGFKKLKKPDEIIKQVDLDRLDIFDSCNQFKYMPLTDTREKLRMKALKSEVRSVTFDGIEQMSDAFLYTLCSCKLDIQTIRYLSFTGCYNVTDNGVYWLLQAFGKNLESVAMDGCEKLTEKSLHYFYNCSSLKELSLTGTSCKMLPEYVYRKKHSETEKPFNVTVAGSRIISPLTTTSIAVPAAPDKPFPVKYRKVVILSPEDLPWNPLAVLTNQTDTSVKPGFTYKQDWQPFKDLGISGVKSSAEIFNVFQMTDGKGFDELVVSPGSIVILPYYLCKDMTANPALKLASIIARVITKYKDCTYVLFGMCASDDSLDYKDTVKQMEQNVLKYLSNWRKRLEKTKNTAINTNWRIAALKHADQVLLNAETNAIETLKYLELMEEKTLTSSFVSVGSGSKMSSKDFKFLEDIVEVDEKYYPWNRTPMMCNKALKYSDSLKKKPFALRSLTEFHQQCTLQGEQGQLFISQVKSLAEFAALWGHCLYFPTLEEKGVVTDFKFLSDIFSKLMLISASKSCNLRCFEGNIPYWTKTDLLNVWKGSTEEQGTMLIRLLEKTGLLLKFPVDPWSSVQDDVSFVYILYKDLPDQQPAILTDYWPLKTPEKVRERERYFFACPGLPDSFFPNLLRHMFKLGSPTVLWRDGAVVVKGNLTLLVEKVQTVDGLQVILVQVRAPGNAELKYNEDWTLLKLYTNIVDYLILKYNIPVAKTVPCLMCRQEKTRYDILSDGKWERFFLEHLIHSVQSKSLKCKVCTSPFSGQIEVGPNLFTPMSEMMAGPDIELWDLVPCHDRNGCALPTSNALNRCLMCENCAVDGIDCDVNLTKGIRNWRCGCEKEGKLCSHCGMCQRCAFYIMKTVAAVEPHYEELQKKRYNQNAMSAVDEIEIVENGSIIGLISKDLEKTLTTSFLRPNYCPDMYLTSVKHGDFTVTLTLLSPNETKIKYDSVSGQISRNGSLVPSDRKPRFQLGDTMHIKLQYIQGGFTGMRLSVLHNDGEIYVEEFEAQKVTVSLNSQQSDGGVFLQIRTPGKFKGIDVKAAKGEKKTCGTAVSNLPCYFEMEMFSQIDKIEQMCFGGRGLNLSGSSCLSLPSKITMDLLKYPHKGSALENTYHHMCLTFSPTGGMSKLGKHGTEGKILRDRVNYEDWKLRRLVHLVDGPGIASVDCGESITEDIEFLLMVWHLIYISYPEVIVPGSMDKLLPDVRVTESNMLQVKEGLRALVRVVFWKFLTKYGIEDLDVKFKVQMLTARNEIVRDALALQELLLEHIQKTGLLEKRSIFGKNNMLYLCPAHAECLHFKDHLTEIPSDISGQYAEFITFVDVSGNALSTIPDEFFLALKNLVDFKCSSNMIDKLPGAIGSCKKLDSIIIYDNNLTDLPQELTTLQSLRVLDISSNRFSRVPNVVMKITCLTKLCIQYMLMTEMPEDIGNLVNLKTLYAQGNCFTKLPESMRKLINLTELVLSGVQWVKLSGNQENVSYQQFYYQTMKRRIERWLRATAKDHNAIFHMFDENSNGVLDIKEVGKLNAAMFNLFPRFGYKGMEPPDETTLDGFPRQILSCKKLTTLHMTHQGFTKVPKEISELTELVELHISYNPNLLSIPAEIGELKHIKKLELEDCPLLKTPPREIRDKGFSSTFAYLKRLMSGAVSGKKTKLMFVGLGGAGKTSLVKAFMSKSGKAEMVQGEGITDGIDIQTWKVEHDNSEITYNIWDFAGQTVYYNTHQFFLSPNRAIYMLLWNVRLGHEHAGLDFWLSSLKVQAPDAPVFVIGSHVDQVSKSELPLEEMKQRYPQVVGFHFISSYTGQGIKELKQNLFDVTLQQKYMGENIPAVWFTFEKTIDLLKSKNDVVDYSTIETVANKSGIFEQSEIFQAVQFLHDLGSVQHFTNEYLKSHVVINPQWIVDVMACVVSVKNDIIKDGRLEHSDLALIWKDYPKNMHKWLLRLTEEFDLTFKLQDENVNLVPCLLPETKAKYDWPAIERGSDILETEMEYTFDYLPAGLFNRAQVRLHDLSDRATIWKNGSFLKKNVHIALLQQTRGNKMIVRAQGPRPENILFLIHEVFEGLVAESFHGVTFDFTMPCPECQRMPVKDPHTFAASTIRRALDMKAPFLQCIKYFHTISCATLQTLLPPDSHSDFDAHLVQSIQGLKDLRKDLVADIFISCCGADNELNESQYIVPNRVYKDLCNQGYRCWYGGDVNNQATDEMARALIDSSVFVAFMSNNYAENPECVNFFKYARLTLRKPMIVVAIGDGFGWKQSTLGMLLADEVFVNMTKSKLEFYGAKYEELMSTLKGKTRTVVDVQAKPVVFFSYTWANSASAVALGTREIPGALGYGDPRKLKTFLEEKGLSCWIDVERVGMNGLFDDIANGLLSAKVVIVCMSDEYANSSACQTEFRYAASTLKLPIILAVVGTGDAWRSQEVGMMSVQAPIVNFQEKTKNAKNKLLALVTKHLKNATDPAEEKNQKNKANEGHKDLSYVELFELAQRKLLRQLTIYAENQDLDVYPRLFVVDFMNEEDVKETKNTETGDSETQSKEKETVDEEKKDVPDGFQNRKKTLSKHASVMSVPAFKLRKFCVYTLCEHDEGWHSVAEPIELPSDFGVQTMDDFSPYLSRVTTVMKYNKKLTLNCISDEVGQTYVEWLEKSPDATMSDYETVYHNFRDMIQSLDTDLKMGNLSRCHLTSGKTIWLCNKHRDSMRVTCLSNEDKSMNLTKESDSKVNNYMITSLRELDPNLMPFEAKPNAVITANDQRKQSSKEDKGKKKTSHHHHYKNKNTSDDTDVPDGMKDDDAEVEKTGINAEKGKNAQKDKVGDMAEEKFPTTTKKSSISGDSAGTLTRQTSAQSTGSQSSASHPLQRDGHNFASRRLQRGPQKKGVGGQSSRACEIS